MKTTVIYVWPYQQAPMGFSFSSYEGVDYLQMFARLFSFQMSLHHKHVFTYTRPPSSIVWSFLLASRQHSILPFVPFLVGKAQ